MFILINILFEAPDAFILLVPAIKTENGADDNKKVSIQEA